MRIDETQHFGEITEAADHALLAWRRARAGRHNSSAIFCRSWCGAYLAPPKIWLFLLRDGLDELAELIDDRDRVEIALPLGVSPGEEAMAAEDDSIATRRFHCTPQHHGQFKAGALPGHPDELVVELLVELFHLFPAVGGGRQCNAPVRMQMVHVRERKKAVQRSVDRSGDGIVAEGAERIHVDHLIFVFDAPIFPGQCKQLIQIKRGEAFDLDAAKVASAALDPQHRFLCPFSGSVSSSFELVLPPPKLVMRRSDPSRFER